MTHAPIRRHRLAWLVASLVFAPLAQAVEILHWNRLPLAVSLIVGQERVVFVDRDVRVGVPASIADHLRVQSAGGAIYLRASAPIEPTRLELQDAADGTMILLDIDAYASDKTQAALEPVKIVVDHEGPAVRGPSPAPVSPNADASGATTSDTPVSVVLTRYAAQSLYAPLRAIEPVSGIAPVHVDRSLVLDTLLPTLPVRATAWAAWRLDDEWVTAVRLTNTSSRHLEFDPRALQGDFVAATFQHPDVGPAGDDTDTTVVYLVTRGHGLAAALLPAISQFETYPGDASATREDGDEK